jgi:hypothetical protein
MGRYEGERVAKSRLKRQVITMIYERKPIASGEQSISLQS